MKKNKRKVLFAFDGYLYVNDSFEFYGVHVNEKIKKRYLQLGDQVSFLMRKKHLDSTNDNSKLSKIESDNFSFIEVPNFKSIRKLFKYYNEAKQLIEEAVKKHDIIIARLPTAIGRLAIQSAQKYNKPHLAEFVGCTFDAYWNYNWLGKIIAHYKMAQMKTLVKDLPYVIYVTREFLQNRYPTKGKTIDCSNVELYDIQSQDLEKRLRRIQSTNIKEMTLATVAAIDVPYKGQDDVIKAIAQLNRKNGWQLRYLIIGQGDDERLKRIAREEGVQDFVEILGSIAHAKVFDQLRDIDLYIQPSKQEGLPRAMIEAMSVACPALGAKTAGIPELIENQCIFQPGRVSELISTIQKIDQSWLKEQSILNFETTKKYHKHVLEKKRADFYQMFLEESNFD